MADDFKYHIDHHAGLTPPPELLQARTAHQRGELDDDGLRAAEDTAITEALRTQRRIGLTAISDGWFRRTHPLSVVFDHVDGFAPAAVRASAVTELMGSQLGELPVVEGPLSARGRLAEQESGFLGRTTGHPLLISLPAPGYLAELSAAADHKPSAIEEAGAQLAGIIGREVAALAAEGVAYVQLHNPLYGYLLSAHGSSRAAELGLDSAAMAERMLTADAAVLAGLETPADFRIGLDLTTAGGAPLDAGYHRPSLAAFLARQPFDRLCVEYPDLPAARFPLAEVRPGCVLSLGIVDVRTPDLESVDELVARVDAAAEETDIDDIAISTNGPFSAADALTANRQREKLQLVEMVARYFWGNEL